jgi:hypothetical protein
MTPNFVSSWRRKPGFGPGHERIQVLQLESDGTPCPAQGSKSDIQCATEDRIPFTMKPQALKQRYEPEIPENGG